MAPTPTPTDATRFTPTGPHARSSPDVMKKSARTPILPGETPLERVQRLRAAAQQEKLNSASLMDKLIDRGRVWADRAHKVTAGGLILATVLCGAITIYTVTDMITTNKRLNKEYLIAQDLFLTTRTPEARTHAITVAMKFGLPEEAAAKYVEDQIKKYEAAKMEAAIKAKLGIKEKGIVDVWKGWLGLDKEVQEGEKRVKEELKARGVEVIGGETVREQVKRLGEEGKKEAVGTGAGAGGVLEAVRELKEQRSVEGEKKEKKGWW
ncbi:hypothetical protein BJ508DRAFT_132765 [Ascobolus immersus RN42]|uniref:Uncharacterized protein n=1 Tax=Ascobolus immersus RN42 TaxID=1160509 RepID=A0A3N4I3C8_ASCIM|nr:hypothetical protein BJ508DRAFT_132765 [Ascobolus immersus RN42]